MPQHTAVSLWLTVENLEVSNRLRLSLKRSKETRAYRKAIGFPAMCGGKAAFACVLYARAMKSKLHVLIGAIAILSAVLTVVAQPRRLTPADILRVATVSDAQISPTGEWIVYSVSTVEGDQTTSTIWIARVGERVSAAPPTSRQPEQRRNWETLRYVGRPLLPPA